MSRVRMLCLRLPSADSRVYDWDSIFSVPCIAGSLVSKASGRSFQQLWRQLDPTRRKQAAAALCAGRENKTEQTLATSVIATKLHLRPQKAAKLPLERKSAYLASIESMEETMAGALVRAYLFTHHRPMLTRFLDQLGIAHQDGVITARNVSPPALEPLRAAVEQIGAQFAPGEVELYLSALLASDPETWANLPLLSAPGTTGPAAPGSNSASP